MYSATCPSCGSTLYSPVPGQAWLACQTCLYFGMLLTTPVTTPQAQVPAHAAASSLAPSPTPDVENSPLSALQRHARRYGEEVAAELATLTPHDYWLSLAQAWDRMQQATDALFRSLGERRMGDYPPNIESVSQALAQVGAWQIIALQAAGRLHEPDGR